MSRAVAARGARRTSRATPGTARWSGRGGRAAGLPRRVVASTDSGDVDVTVPRGVYAVQTDTDSGDVDIDAAIVRDDRAPRSIDAETDSGDVTLQAR